MCVAVMSTLHHTVKDSVSDNNGKHFFAFMYSNWANEGQQICLCMHADTISHYTSQQIE